MRFGGGRDGLSGRTNQLCRQADAETTTLRRRKDIEALSKGKKEEGLPIITPRGSRVGKRRLVTKPSECGRTKV